MRFFLCCLTLLLLGACPGLPGPDGGVIDTADASASLPRFTSTSAPPDSGLWLTADFTKPTAPRLEVWGQRLGDVFGYAFHVALEGSALVIVDPLVEPALGGDATTVLGGTTTDRSFGAVRRGPSAGTTRIDAATRLASFTVTTTGAAETTLTLERGQVRRADGAFVPLTFAGGTLSLPGVSQ